MPRGYIDNLPLREALRRHSGAKLGPPLPKVGAAGAKPEPVFQPVPTEKQRRAQVVRMAKAVQRFAQTPPQGPIPTARPGKPWTPKIALDSVYETLVGALKAIGRQPVRQNAGARLSPVRQPMSQRMR